MLVKGEIQNNLKAISGGLCAGKTTAAEYLKVNHKFNILGFATPLYILCAIHHLPEERWKPGIKGWIAEYLVPTERYSEDQLDEFLHQVLLAFDTTERDPGKNRTLLQRVGTEVGRAFDPDLWVNLFEDKLTSLGDDARVVNDNLRFPNEIEASDNLGFVKVYLDIDPELQKKRYKTIYGKDLTKEQLSHKSEAHLELAYDRADAVFNNSYNRPEPLYAFLEDLLYGK